MNLKDVRKGQKVVFVNEPSLEGLSGTVIHIGATKHYGPDRSVRVRIYDGSDSWLEFTNPKYFELEKK